MPMTSFPARYRSKNGPTPLLSPSKLTPLGNDDLPMLRQDTQDSNAQSNETPNTYGPPPIPQPRAPIPFRTSFHKELAKPQTIEAPKPHASFSGIKGLMPPPGIKRHAAGDIVGLNGPELGIIAEDQPEAVVPVSTDPTALPPLDNPDAPTNTAPGGEDEGTVAPPTAAAPPNNIPPEPTPPAPVGATQAIPQGAFPSGDASASQAIPNTAFPGSTAAAPTDNASGVRNATEALRDLKAPVHPQSNWAQRLGLAALALTKFAPVANQIIHPKWSQDMAAYQGQQSDLERRQKEEETAAATEAQVAQRDAAAEQKRAQAANYALADQTRLAAEQDRLQANKDRIKAQASAQNKKFLEDQLKGRMEDSNYQQQTDPMPAGYQFVPDPEKPGFGFAAPPAWRPAPAALAPFLAVQPNDMIAHSDYKKAITAMNAQQLVGAKATTKPEAQLTAEDQMLLHAAGGDLSKGPNEQDPAVVQRFLALKKERPPAPNYDEKQAKNAAINNAFRAAGGDWNKVAEMARNGQVEPAFAADIAEHADKASKLPPTQQTKVTAAETTMDTATKAIAAIDAFTKAHPNLTGSVLGHPINAGLRKAETWSGTEPSDIGAVDTLLESIAALQPGQHGFRSAEASENFKKATGIDFRSHQQDGSRAWLVNPGKAKEAIQQLADFNENLRDNTLKTAGRAVPQHGPAPAVVPTPKGAVDLNQFHIKPQPNQ